MRVKAKSAIVIGVVAIVALATWVLWPRGEQSETVLSWQDSATGVSFLVTEKPGAMVHTWTHLSVSRGDDVQDVQLDDDACFGLAELVRWQDWLLVVNDEYVMGGYNYSTGLLYGEHQWDQLPFTVRTSAGQVVAQSRIRDKGGLPAQFPIVAEPAAAMPAPTTKTSG